MPDLVQWSEQCQQAFVRVEVALCGDPLGELVADYMASQSVSGGGGVVAGGDMV